MKYVQNCNNVIIVVVVVVVVVRDVFDLIVVVIIFQISLTTKIFEAKTDFIQKNLAQKRCWCNKMFDKKKGSKKVLILKNFGYKKKFAQKSSSNQVSNN